MLKAVIFDMDGLLLDTETLAMKAWLGAGQALHMPLKREMMLRTIGVNWEGTKRTIARILGDDLPFDELRGKMRELFQQMLADGELRVMPGAAELLRALREEDVPMGLATSTVRAGATQRLEMAGLLEFFSGLACGEEVAHGKPDPDIFLLSAQRVGVAPELCAALEDSPAGIRAAKAAGMTTIMVPGLVQPDGETRGFADHVVKDLFQAKELLFRDYLR